MSCTHVGSVGIIRLKRNIYQNKAEKLQNFPIVQNSALRAKLLGEKGI